MPTLTITLPAQQLEKAKEQARHEGFKNPNSWLQFLISNRLILEESPRLKPSEIILEMRKTGLYKTGFLSDLKKSLEYADKAYK